LNTKWLFRNISWEGGGGQIWKRGGGGGRCQLKNLLNYNFCNFGKGVGDCGERFDFILLQRHLKFFNSIKSVVRKL
jgi:hypothetical protein